MTETKSESNSNVRDWLALERIPLVGPLTIAKLVDAFGCPREILKANARSIRLRTGLSERLSNSISCFKPESTEIERDLATLEQLNARVLTRWDEGYPKNLKDIYDPPALLFVRGSLLPVDTEAVAVVGTRNPTRYGVELAKSITGHLVRSNFTVVSGLARGIDTTCHLSALKAGGRTIAVLGCGLDISYPRENESLIERIVESGAVISEFRPGTAPLKTNFFRRNRIVSGLSRAVVVVQASRKSGSLITASHALDQNRDVFAVPGNVTDERSRGPHYLIKQGAGLVESAEDILPSLISPQTVTMRGYSSSDEIAITKVEISETAKIILDFLDLDPTPIDLICESIKIETGKLLGSLLELELLGLVRQSPGKMFSRIRV
ncbi:MAG: DNA-processing protein DprA [Pseudomonadota bacterium]